MKVAILNITAGNLSGGSKKYLKNVIPRMAEDHRIDKILCAYPEKTDVSGWFEDIKDVIFCECKPFSVLPNKDVRLYSQLEKFQPDIIFIPLERYFTYKNTPVVCMLRNMLPFVDVEHINLVERIRNQIQKFVAYRAMNKATRIIAISGFVSDFLQKRWHISSEKIGIAYHGVAISQEVKEVCPLTIPWQWKEGFIFTAGSIETYRGIEDILGALKQLKQKGLDRKVVIAGQARRVLYPYYKKLKELVCEMGLEENVCWAGMLNESELKWCYKHAKAYFMGSRVEACPNTALEAMLYGSVIMSTTKPPMPEVFADVAAYYEAGDINKLISLIENAYGFSAQQREVLSRKVKRRVADFSWEKTVDITITEFQKILQHKQISKKRDK